MIIDKFQRHLPVVSCICYNTKENGVGVLQLYYLDAHNVLSWPSKRRKMELVKKFEILQTKAKKIFILITEFFII